MSDETEAVAQLQVMGFQWNEQYAQWSHTASHMTAIVYPSPDGWWALYGGATSPLGVDNPLDVVEWVQLEMDANG